MKKILTEFQATLYAPSIASKDRALKQGEVMVNDHSIIIGVPFQGWKVLEDNYIAGTYRWVPLRNKIFQSPHHLI